MAWWILENVNGIQVVDVDPKDPQFGEVSRWAKVPRVPSADGTEDWDWKAKAWVINAERALAVRDATYRHENGALAIELAQRDKALEARLMLAGVPLLDGQVKAEALALGVTPLAYARTVLDKATAAPNAELERILDKAGLRNKLGIK